MGVQNAVPRGGGVLSRDSRLHFDPAEERSDVCLQNAVPRGGGVLSRDSRLHLDPHQERSGVGVQNGVQRDRLRHTHRVRVDHSSSI